MKRVLVYEINEVPWTVWDRYVFFRPESNVAELLKVGFLRTTVDHDDVDLMPWRSWPTLHRSMYSKDHKALDQGQDPASFGGVPIWDVVDQAKLPVGLFGVLQSWPARAFEAGGFYVPDSFARSDEVYPARLEAFQAFNRRMTEENSFGPSASLDRTVMAKAGMQLLTNGFSPWSAAQLVKHLFHEARDDRFKASRATVQVLPCFDLFWRLQVKHMPALSIFFTNHVASMMHRFWGDWMEGYDSGGYQPDDVYQSFVVKALDYFDHQLGQMMQWTRQNPGTLLVIASAIGQHAIPFEKMASSYLLEDAGVLTAKLNLQVSSSAIAMYPRINFMFDSGRDLEAAQTLLERVRTSHGPLFNDFRQFDSTLAFQIRSFSDAELDRSVSWEDPDGSQRQGSIQDLGITVRSRPGGGNTAHHTPEGSLLGYGAELLPDPSRRQVDILDVAPSLLHYLGLAPDPTMQGSEGLFEQALESVS